MDAEDRKWLVILDKLPEEEFSLKALKFINLDLVRIVDQMTPDHIRLVFSPDQTVEIHGGGAGELVLTLMARGITAAGLPYSKPEESMSEP
jgi:hypothetical protein